MWSVLIVATRAVKSFKPCKDCKDRWINVDENKTCHSSCSKYLSYKDALKKAKEHERLMSFIPKYLNEAKYPGRICNPTRPPKTKKSLIY